VNLSLLYLRSRVPTLPDSADEVAARLRGLGFDVERTVPLAELLRPVVVAHVESVTQHPNADRLRICSVNDGTEQRLQIVTGAPNVQAGAHYPLVRSGTTLPNGTRIKRGKLRDAAEAVGAIAATGVDLVSVGALTHSAPVLDIGLDVTPTTGSVPATTAPPDPNEA